MTNLFDAAAQYGSIAKWFTEDDIKIVTLDEPRLDIMDESNNAVLITLKPSGIQYNRDAFCNDTYAEAAKRVAERIRTHLNNTLNAQFLPYKDIEAKFFIVNDQGVQHNYEVDTWHYWMLNSLNELFLK
jgi:hypothetical protein